MSGTRQSRGRLFLLRLATAELRSRHAIQGGMAEQAFAARVRMTVLHKKRRLLHVRHSYLPLLCAPH